MRQQFCRRGFAVRACYRDDWHFARAPTQLEEPKKVTVELPEDLLRRAQKATGQGISGTIRTGLQLVAATGAYEALRRLCGRVRCSVRWRELREDR